MTTRPRADRPRLDGADMAERELSPDCRRCFGLCCVAPALRASPEFAIEKDANEPCLNLRADDFRCRIHDTLRHSGFPGCAIYDCYGAGQRVAQETFGGTDWRQAPHTSTTMFATFMIMRQLHELLWYLDGALRLTTATALHDELRQASAEIDLLASGDAVTLLGLDVAAHRREVEALLLRTGAAIRGQ
ncbi:hypothetical protein ACQPYK_21070 [Streptosporangium sp. CA-135522]|uniref:hypothetical protein n=1 Tax=Streptosporangium sp. CA-135522 TaxID=3240072 RepID=UPI003D8E7769